MTISLGPPPPDSSYLVVAENWYHDWRASVDGRAARVYRGNWSLITVPLGAGAKQVDLVFDSPAYQRGKLLTILSTLIALGLVIAPGLGRWWRARRSPTVSANA